MHDARSTSTRWPGARRSTWCWDRPGPGPEPLHRQLYGGLRTAILEQRLRPGARLPSTRALASTLGLAQHRPRRLRSAPGRRVPGDPPRVRHLRRGEPARRAPGGRRSRVERDRRERCPRPAPPSVPSSLSNWGRRVAEIAPAPYAAPTSALPIDFRHGPPDVVHFPIDEWRRAAARQLRQIDRDDLWYGPPAGLPSLREALAEYLGRARGLRCAGAGRRHAGTQQAIDLISRLLVEADDVVVLEDPCYPGARRVFEALAATLLDVPVDEHGLRKTSPDARPAGLHHAVAPVPERRDAAGSSARPAALGRAPRRPGDRGRLRQRIPARWTAVGGAPGPRPGRARGVRRQLFEGALPGPAPGIPGGAAGPSSGWPPRRSACSTSRRRRGQEMLAEWIHPGSSRLTCAECGGCIGAAGGAAGGARPRARPRCASPSDAGLYLRVVLAEGMDEEAVARRAAELGRGGVLAQAVLRAVARRA